MSEMSEAQKRLQQWAIKKGWRGEGAPAKTFGDEIALMHSELSEAIDAYRTCGSVTKVWYTVEVPQDLPIELRQLIKKLQQPVDGPLTGLTEEEWDVLVRYGVAKPEGVPSELADTVIRIMETAEDAGIDLWKVIEQKMAYNDTRAFRHGGRHL